MNLCSVFHKIEHHFKIHLATYQIVFQEWSDKLANMAQSFATKCELRSNPDRHNSIPSMKTVGEIWCVTSIPSPEKAVEQWFYEGSLYDFKTKECGYKSGCNNFTQVRLRN